MDNISKPQHYTNGSIECIDAIQAMLSHDEFIGYLRGNIFKYQWRYKHKNGLEDLEKAKWYQDRLISYERFIGMIRKIEASIPEAILEAERNNESE